VVFDAFDHHLVLKACVRNLHSACVPDCRVRHVAIASDFVGGVDYDDSFLSFIS
jgi:hypothetical protein